MGKSAVSGNKAVATITPTSTTKATTSIPKTTTTTTKTTTTAKSSSSSGSSGSAAKSAAAAAPVAAAPSLASQVYNAYKAMPPGVDIGSSPVITTDPAIVMDANRQAAATRALVEAARANLPAAPEVQKVERIDITDQLKELQQLADQKSRQAVNSINYAVQTGKNDLSRAYEDALPQYQTERNKIAADEARALDNQVLYASRRGDAGGIGQSQYGSIQNTAAANRQTVNNAQIKLYTDTSRQIADLESKGEFEKADKLLEISQDYTSKLMDLQKWAKEKNIGVDEFNSKVDQWKADYDLSVSKYLTDTELNAAKATGAFSNGALTADAKNDIANRYATAGKAMMSAGIVPSADQLAAMGWTPEQYWIYQMANSTV